MGIKRRDFLAGGGALAASALAASQAQSESTPEQPIRRDQEIETITPHGPGERLFGAPYCGEDLNQIAFPMGGFGAGMVCLEGTGALSKFSLRNRPDLTSEPKVFAAVASELLLTN